MSIIVDTDNFGGDYPNERILLWPMSRKACERICAILNEAAGPHARRYYKVEENVYELQPGFEP